MADKQDRRADDDHPPLTPQPVPVGRRPRLIGRDMLLSMGLVTAVLLIWLLFAHPWTPDKVRTVEWQPVAQAAVETAGYEVLAPPQSWDWRATSARIEPQPDGTIAWRVGFYTPEDRYAAVLQRGEFPDHAARAKTQWLDSETRQGEAEGTVIIGGRTWTRMEGDPAPDERRSLVCTSGGTLTVVTGSAEWDELEQLAASLTVQEGTS